MLGDCNHCEEVLEFVNGEFVCLKCDGIECVSVGGGADGSRIKVHDPYTPMLTREPSEVLISRETIDLFEEHTIRTELYRPVWIGKFVFYRYEELSDTEAVLQLIRGYKQCISKDNQTDGRAV
jgi:hypothetical protein